MIRAVIIDDEINGVKSLELTIATFNKDVEVVNSTTDPVEGIEMINSSRPDVVFLDISMPKLNGFEMLEKLEYKDFHLIFTTAYKKYALQALKQEATDYLLKPVDARELNKAVEKVKQNMAEKSRRPDIFQLLKEIAGMQCLKVHLPTKSGTEYVTPNDIVYIEADSNYSKVFLTNGSTVNVTNALKEYEQLLCTKELFFIRVHKSFIINLNYVTRYLRENGGSVVVKGNITIPISRPHKETFLRAIHLEG